MKTLPLLALIEEAHQQIIQAFNLMQEIINEDGERRER